MASSASSSTSLASAAPMASQNPVQYVLDDWPAGLSEPGPTPSTAGPMESKTMALVEKGVSRRPPKKNANTALKASCVASSNDDADSGNTCKANPETKHEMA